jgi:hypothetical protein
MKWFPAICLLVPCAVSVALAQTTDPKSFVPRRGQISFTTPSQNVECTYTPAGGTPLYKPVGGGPELSCDRAKPSYVNVTLGRTGPARQISNPGEQSCCAADNVLPYRAKWSQGPFTCRSAEKGLTCSRSDGHGFFISQKTIKVH